MPFKVNEAILAVDPVKLYEYIDFGKNILSIEYPEIERFKDFVYFYTDYESYIRQIDCLLNTASVKYTVEHSELFLNQNTWQCRATEIARILEG